MALSKATKSIKKRFVFFRNYFKITDAECNRNSRILTEISSSGSLDYVERACAEFGLTDAAARHCDSCLLMSAVRRGHVDIAEKKKSHAHARAPLNTG